MWLVLHGVCVWHQNINAIRLVSFWRFSVPGAYGTTVFPCRACVLWMAGMGGGHPAVGSRPGRRGGAVRPSGAWAAVECSSGIDSNSARRCSGEFLPNFAVMYGTRFSVPYRISPTSQALKPWVLAFLLSRPPKCPDPGTSSRSAASFPELLPLSGNLFVYAWLRGVVGRRSGDVRNCWILRHCVHDKASAKRSAQRIAATRTAAWLSMALCRSSAAP